MPVRAIQGEASAGAALWHALGRMQKATIFSAIRKANNRSASARRWKNWSSSFWRNKPCSDLINY